MKVVAIKVTHKIKISEQKKQIHLHTHKCMPEHKINVKWWIIFRLTHTMLVYNVKKNIKKKNGA